MKTLALFGLLAASAFGADQSLNISAGLTYSPSNPTTTVLKAEDARILIQSALGIGHPEADRTYIIHAAEYQQGRQTPSQQHWYVFNPDGKLKLLKSVNAAATPARDCTTGAVDSRVSSPSTAVTNQTELSEDPRILGIKKLGMVYLHIACGLPEEQLNAAINSEDVKEKLAKDAKLQSDPLKEEDLDPQITSFRASIRRVRPATLSLPEVNASHGKKEVWQELQVLKWLIDLHDTGISDSVALAAEGRVKLAPFGGLLVDEVLTKLVTIGYRIEIAKKKPQPLEHLSAIAGLAIGAQGEFSQMTKIVKLRKVGFAAGGVFNSDYVPSNMDITAAYTTGSDGKETEIGKQSFLNEGLYWYDFSLALPVKTYNEFRYNQTSGGITVNKIEKVNVWALFNAGIPRDLTKTHLQYIPTFVYGMPIAGQPLKHHMFGGAIGLNRANFFVGVRMDRKVFVTDYTRPLSGSNTFQLWRTHLTYGINFPVGTVVDALKQKAKGN